MLKLTYSVDLVELIKVDEKGEEVEDGGSSQGNLDVWYLGLHVSVNCHLPPLGLSLIHI